MLAFTRRFFYEFFAKTIYLLYTYGGLILISGCLIVFTSAQTISLPLWESSFNIPASSFSGPYIILTYTCLALVIINFVCCVFCYFIQQRPPIASLRENFFIYFLVGLSMAVNGLLLVYASLPSRTPELLQPILLNTGFLWSLPLSKFLIEEKSKYQYCQWTPLAAIGFVVWGICISLFPTFIAIFQEKQKFFGEGGFVWAIVFMISVAPGALSNVFMERFFKKRAECPQKTSHVLDTFVLNFWATFFQLLILASFFWVDIIPGFGFSGSLDSFAFRFNASSYCLFDIKECPRNWWLGFIFISCFATQNVMSALLSADSANFVNIAMNLATPTSTLFWIIFPFLQSPDQPTMPLWSIIPSLLFLMMGLVMWKIWEIDEKNKILEREKVFSLNLGVRQVDSYRSIGNINIWSSMTPI